MAELFRIRTDRVSIHWSGPPDRRRTNDASGALERVAQGTLRIQPRRPNLALSDDTRRAGVPPPLAVDVDATVGPALVEETSYDVLVRGPAGSTVTVRHRDPGLPARLTPADDPSILHGSINFRGQIGESRFAVLVDGEPELDFTVEVFPSKIAYREDYARMMGRVQDLAAGLALEYLRSTYQLGAAVGSADSSRLDWLALLRHLLDGLEQSLQHLAVNPTRTLVRESRFVRLEQLRRSDHALRTAVIRDRGRGPRHRLKSGVPVRSHMPETRAQPTLDTPEHRWLAAQIARARRQLATLVTEEETRLRTGRFTPSDADRQAVKELQEMEARVAALERLEPLGAATAHPPPGFTSLILQGAPGYRESYHALIILTQGLRVGGGPVELSVKDLHLLYEYWCFLEVVKQVADLLHHPIPPRALIEVKAEGLRLRLEQGRAQTVPFQLPGGRSVEVTYNPTFQEADVLLPQRPDIVLTFLDPNWPAFRLVLDAKYQVQNDQEFVERFGAPGPPTDSVNVIHRYRDAILEADAANFEFNSYGGAGSAAPKRTVIEGAALFPLGGEASEGFDRSRFWDSLERLGIGALPFLPGSTRYVELWLRRVMRRSGWKTADRAVSHRIRDQAERWANAADEAVLVGVLRGGKEAEHLNWMHTSRLYYTRLTPTQKRQIAARWVAVYSPARVRGGGLPGAVTYVARVEGVEVRHRNEIDTPWASATGENQLQVLYRLGPLTALRKPVENRGLEEAGGTRFSTNRWTSRLALERADEVTELLLESQIEWEFYELLRTLGRDFRLRVDRQPGEAAGQDGRVWFVLDDRSVRWAGAKGWEVRKDGHLWFSGQDPLVCVP